MSPIEPPDTHRFSAAEGWLELGNPGEAAEEWDRMSAAARGHPAALELRWHILARLERWREAVEVGASLVAQVPESSGGWLHRAYALRRAPGGGLAQAWAVLRPAAEHFPDNETIAFNLACYATQLGRLDEGWEWFLRSLQIGKEPARIRAMALRDPDLEPLWTRIREVR